jgi:hypothetical protein
MDGIHGYADNGAGGKVLSVDCNAARKNDTRKVAGHGGSATKSFFNASVEICARVEFIAVYNFRC